MYSVVWYYFFFFKQKTAYEMRISDWSSDVCSSDLGVGLVDVLGVAAERDPAERADAAAEQRAHVGRDEAGKVEGVLAAFVEFHLADVVAVVDGGDALLLEREHCLDVHAHGFLGGVADFFGWLRLFGEPLPDAPPHRPRPRPG